MITLEPRMMIRFCHADAVVEPEPRRPATVAEGPLATAPPRWDELGTD